MRVAAFFSVKIGDRRRGRRAGEGELGPMKTKYAPFRATDYLNDEEVIAEYLTAATDDGNPDVLRSALAEVAKARGMSQVASAAGIDRACLYKAFCLDRCRDIQP